LRRILFVFFLIHRNSVFGDVVETSVNNSIRL